ncbi:hypothetical protein Rsub_02392 [Raphidocelis subcapitata]|uniref:Uncharacterized protein n=1 Tax=Raphidocelis subcapitata TaxID=307507 RepID=A0A2V0NRL5_9CHLO|nr:hypothetical protein Rsub_02392 [Raphidocelis subcapitata]|eukprot:GBF90286.1 hypothetical protein Rsub_02392 [Raphidocelis subcapitata]
MSTASTAAATARLGRSGRSEGLPLSLFHPYSRLPPEGSTLMREDELCDPQESICKTPSHTYEAECLVCSGTGWARNASNGRRGTLGTCILCHGLGYVRRTTARFVPDSDASLTIGRTAPPPKKRPLFEPRKKAGGPPAMRPPAARAPTARAPTMRPPVARSQPRRQQQPLAAQQAPPDADAPPSRPPTPPAPEPRGKAPSQQQEEQEQQQEQEQRQQQQQPRLQPS